MATIEKKLLPATILIAAALGFTSMSQASPGDGSASDGPSWHQDGQVHDQEYPHRHEGPGGHNEGEQRLLAALGLSDAQREQVKSIHERARSQAETLESNERANHEKIMALSPKDPSFASLVKAEKENAAARVQLRADVWTQTYSILTPGQQGMIPVLVTAAKNERAAREAAWNDHEAKWKRDDKGMPHDQDHQDQSASRP